MEEKEKTVHETPGSLNQLLVESIKKNWDHFALSDMGGVNYQYKDVAEVVEKLRLMFKAAGVKRGDRVAICGKNSSNWVAVLLACLASGAVAVPILHEFKPDTITYLLKHSGSKLLFVDASIWENLDEMALPDLVGAIYISEFGMPLSRSEKLTDVRNNINEYFGKEFPYSFTRDDVKFIEDKPEELAIISYTSGSTGMSKGVMLPYRSLWSNVRFCLDNIDYLHAGDGVVNMLPLAHLYGMTIDVLHPFCQGCRIRFLTKLPSPKVILGAFAEVKPKLIITVPLILEKIIRNKVFPVLEKPLMKVLLHIPYVDTKLLGKIKENLLQAFGGNVREVIVGGAPLNPDVEKFLSRIDFPVTVGYGMTECGPLLTYAPSNETKPHTVGRLMDRMELKIDSPDPENIPGNIWVRGMNVMQGYYKNKNATREVMPDDSGWMNTGDMGVIDEDGFIRIMGRSKTMILGPSGQNIYPEEIEAKLNNLPYVAESLIIDHNGVLEALVYPEMETLISLGKTRDDIQNLMDENLQQLNLELPAYCKVARLKVMNEEFEKTPKRSIKRFLYQP